MKQPLTSDEAIDLLIRNPDNYSSFEQLKELAARVDADAPGKLTILYSGLLLKTSGSRTSSKR